MTLQQNRQDLCRIAVSVILTALAFLSPALSPLAYVSLVPVFRVLFFSRQSMKTVFFYGWLFGTLFYLSVLHWLLQLHPLDFLDLSWSVSLLIVLTAWILISLLEGLFYALAFLLFRKLSCQNGCDLLTLSFLWILMEWTQGLGILGFPFCRLCLTQYQNLPAIQSVSLFGSYFLSFLLVFGNACIAYCLTDFRQKGKKWLSIALAVCLLNHCYGLYQINQESDDAKPLKAVLIQGNISSHQKWADNTAATIFQTYEALTRQALEKEQPDLVIWPETVLPFDLNDTVYLQKLKKMAADFQTPLMVGGFYYDKSEQKDYNTVYEIQTDGQISAPLYAKRKLVPFGEFLPFRKTLGHLFPILKDINATGSDLTAGKESIPNVLPMIGSIGSLICFDSVFPQIARESVKNGAGFLTLVTNDSWFQDSAGVYQHNAHAVLRAVENRRWIARAANTGISCFISPKGEIREALLPLTIGYTVSEFFPSSEKSLYTKIGDLFLYAGVIYLLWIGKEKKWKTFSRKRLPSHSAC